MKRCLPWFCAFLVAFVIAGSSTSVFAQQQDTGFSQAEQADVVQAVRIFPNPAAEFVHVRLEQLSTSRVKLSLYNLIGNEMKIEPEVVSETEFRVRVKELDPGYYFIALSDDSERYRSTYKFLKK